MGYLLEVQSQMYFSRLPLVFFINFSIKYGHVMIALNCITGAASNYTLKCTCHHFDKIFTTGCTRSSWNANDIFFQTHDISPSVYSKSICIHSGPMPPDIIVHCASILDYTMLSYLDILLQVYIEPYNCHLSCNMILFSLQHVTTV